VTHDDPTRHDPTIAAEFYATLLGGTVSCEPPRPDSMLAWLQSQPPEERTPEAINAEFKRRGIPEPDPEDAWAWENPRYRRPRSDPQDT
jgi:hypothetical protein